METPRRVAFVCPRLTSLFSRSEWYSLQDAAVPWGVRLTVVVGGVLDEQGGQSAGREIYRSLDLRNFDGAILATGELSVNLDAEQLSEFLESLSPLPVVSLGPVLPGFLSVGVDQAQGMEDMVRHLHDVHGYRRFAFVAGPPSHVDALVRRQTFYQTLHDLGVPSDQIEEFPGNFSVESGASAVHRLKGLDGPPLALICANDDEAIGALEECKALGIAVPQQVAVVGFDDMVTATIQEPSLTTVGQPFIQLAEIALRLLIRQMEHRENAASKILPARIFFRESCGCTPQVEPMLATDKASLVVDLLSSQTNVTDGFRSFVREWLADYLAAFEEFLATENPAALRRQWYRYHTRHLADQERGVPFRRLFVGLQVLYSSHPAFAAAYRENLLMAGAYEARNTILNDQAAQAFFLRLQTLQAAISQINERSGLASIPSQELLRLGITGVALIRSGVPARLVHFQSLWTSSEHQEGEALDELTLLPPSLEKAAPEAHRVAAAMTAEGQYLGHAVFWITGVQAYVCDLLATQFAGALYRLELLERIRDQSLSLQASLEETRRMQKQLVETEKVASLGRLVAGVAHELNTPLGTGITGTSFLLDRTREIRNQLQAATLARSTLDHFLTQGQEALEGVLRNLMKAGELIQAFKGLGLDHGQGEWRPVDLRVLFGDLGKLYAVELAKRGQVLEWELPEEETMVYSQPSALVQVAGELLDNAMEHAFPPGFLGNPRVVLQIQIDGETLRLSVTDNGRGLLPDERRHLFDPLYTTLRPQGHAGLGLHLAFQLVTRTLGGHMTVTSDPGGGSSFLCLIPINQT